MQTESHTIRTDRGTGAGTERTGITKFFANILDENPRNDQKNTEGKVRQPEQDAEDRHTNDETWQQLQACQEYQRPREQDGVIFK